MPNTFTQIHIHAIFAVQNRLSLITKTWEKRLYQYITGIVQNHFVAGKFSWQDGYGAFSYSKSQIQTVGNYIENQELHHKKKSFIEEYSKILEDFKIEFDEKYIFKPIDDDLKPMKS